MEKSGPQPRSPGRSGRPRVLVIASMYPNDAHPQFGVFVHRRIRAVSRYAAVTVLSPIPYFPFTSRLKRYIHRSNIKPSGTLDDIPVVYPRHLSVPRFCKALDGILLGVGVLWSLWRSRKLRSFDLVDAHLAYPDGFGALIVATVLRIPYTVTLRGHDINHIPQFPARRRQIVQVLSRAASVMSVAEALRKEALSLGASDERSITIPNAVEPEIFRTLDKLEARKTLSIPVDSQVVVAVGNLVERKGHHLVIEAFCALYREDPRRRLLIVGGPNEEGDMTGHLRTLIETHQLQHAISLVGPQPPEQLPLYYNAADVSVLASSKEGWANVLLESLACGTPVVATRVWGTPEVLSKPAYGILCDRTVPALEDALRRGLSQSWDREEIVTYARAHSWASTGKAVATVYSDALGLPRDVLVKQLEATDTPPTTFKDEEIRVVAINRSPEELATWLTADPIRNLYAEANSPSSALHPDWLATWLRTLATSAHGERARYWCFYTQSGNQITAMLPLILPTGKNSHTAYFMGWGSPAHLDLYPQGGDVLYRRGFRSHAEKIAQYVADTWSVTQDIRSFGLGPTDREQPLTRFLIRSRGIERVSTGRVISYTADLSMGFEHYVAKRSQATRYRCRRLLRRLERSGVVFEIATDLPSLNEYFADLVNLHQSQWQLKGQTGAFSSEAIKRFHLSLFQSAPTFPLLTRLRRDGRTLAVVYCLQIGSQAELYQCTYQPDMTEIDPVISPGTTALLRTLEYLSNTGVRTFNFLSGQADYKRQLSDQASEPIIVAPPRHPIAKALSVCKAVLG